jgi:two-component system sporulation sensor kinase A
MEGTANNLLDNPSVRGIVFTTRDVTERILAEEKFRGLIENAHDVISVLSEDGTTQYLSRSMTSIMGYTPEERIGRPFLEIVHPDDRPELTRKLEELNRWKGGTVTAQVRALHKNGSWRIIEGAGTNLIDNPAIRGIVLNYRDVTERIQAEEAQKQSQESFRAMIEKSPDGILLHRGDRISYANPAFLRLAGYEKVEEVIGQAWNFHLPPEEYQEVWDRIQSLAKPGVTHPPKERTIKRKDGTLVPVESLSFNVEVENEILAVGVMRDLSERKEAAKALKQSEESFRNLIENSPDAIMIHTKAAALYVNPAFLQLLGYENAGELVGKSWKMVVPSEEAENVEGRISHLGEKFPVNPSIERRLLKKNGQTIPVEVVSFNILFEGEAAMAALFRDLTERKNAEQILLKYTRLGTIGEMAAGLAHEIRNPLSGIGLSAQYLKRKMVEAPDAVIQVQNILDQTERLKQLVNDTLDFSRETPLQDLARVDAMDLMLNSLRFVQVQFGPGHHRVEVKWAFEKERFFVYVNKNRIQQVLVNLMLNAFQAMEKGGTLTLGCAQNAQKTILSVEDDGPGISPDVQTRLFEPFFTTKPNGSGLGLSVSQRIVEAHGGVLRVEILPRGTAFVIELPVHEEQNTLTPKGNNP